MRKLACALIAFGLVSRAIVGCGSDDETNVPPGTKDGGDGSSNADGSGNGNGDGGTLTDGAASDGKVVIPFDAAHIPDGAVCTVPGEACVGPTECCTGRCVDNKCGADLCVPDKPTPGNCTVAGECCSGICEGGKCASVNGTGGGSCRTAGNPCDSPDQCCSDLCLAGICSSKISFCTQQSEICSNNTECCSGNCVKTGTNLTGTCGTVLSGGGVPSGCAVAGIVCGEGVQGDAGLPPCDQNCCSRACGYGGAFPGFRVCQPPSGCKPTGEICRNDSDCCGWSGAPYQVVGPVSCSKRAQTDEFGRCDNGGSCREPGSICKPGDGDSCSAENNCCEDKALVGASYCNSNPENCCNKDALGIPRCLVKPVDCTGTDGGTPPKAGDKCATSADCCGAPCIDNKCFGGTANACVAQGGSCTVTADCCPGLPCVQAPGSTRGVCGGTLLTDGGVSDAGGGGGGGGSCALYGQTCNRTADCCNNVDCTSGRCRYP